MTDALRPLALASKEEHARIVASVARRVGDLELAEDAVQEAYAAAAARWPTDGVPDRPGAWLTTTAWRRAIDALRRRRRGHAVAATLSPTSSGAELGGGADGSLPVGEDLRQEDDLLQLLLTCCHPALAPEARVALTLRHVAGLSVREIAAAFLVEEPAMTKRLVRARAKIRDGGIPFELPDHAGLSERLAAVHAVVYLLFSEGYLASGDGPAIRTELCDEAVWLARQLHRLLPGDAETTGLLALLLFHAARTPARHDAGGGLVPHADQDRGRWDHATITEARRLLATTGVAAPGPYQVEAAIAALHTTADDAASVPWSNIVEMYELLARLNPSPIVDINRAVAIGRVEGPAAGLAVLAPVLASGALAGYLPLHAAHADLLQRAGEPRAAGRAWRAAAELTANAAQRAELLRRADACR